MIVVAVQVEVDKVVLWSRERHMPLLIAKCAAMHGGHNQLLKTSYINNTPIPTVDSFSDLRGLATTNSAFQQYQKSVK